MPGALRQAAIPARGSAGGPRRKFTVAGLEEGSVFEGSFLPDDVVSVGVNVVSSQTDVTSVTYSVDGVDVATLTESPYTLDMSLLEDLGTGQHTLEVTVTNAGGQTTTETITFSVVVVPTPTPFWKNCNLSFPLLMDWKNCPRLHF